MRAKEAAPIVFLGLLAGSARAGLAEQPASAAPSAQAKGQPSRTRTQAHKYTLDQLIQRAHGSYPGVAAARHALSAMQRKLFQAKWAWVPRGTIKGLFAPTPEIRCAAPGSIVPALNEDGSVRMSNGNPTWVNGGQASQAERENWCVNTDVQDFSLKFNGVFARIQLELAMPLYTFDKIGSAQRAATAGVQARQAGVDAARQNIALNVTRAYWGLKLAREMIYTIKSGRKHLVRAREQLEQQLDEGEGEATVTDVLRLKTAAAEIDAQLLEATRLADIARDSLALICGLTPENLRIDDSVIAAMKDDLGPLPRYLEGARKTRPEVKMLDAATSASTAKVSLEKARLLPDFLLIGRLGIGASTNIDDPENTFFSDPFNYTSSGLALALNWNLNTVEQYGKYKEAAAGARHAFAKRSEGLLGIRVEVRKSYLELREAQQRLGVTNKGARAARSWLVATSQNLAAGLSEPKELTDALIAYFRLRLRHLRAIFEINVGWAKLARAIGRPLNQLTLPAR